MRCNSLFFWLPTSDYQLPTTNYQLPFTDYFYFSGMIQVFVTGGTFDKEYNYITGELYFEDTHLKEMFDRGRCTVDVDVKTLMMLDSLDMTEEDRGIIVHNCARSHDDMIIITHGTD